MAKKQPKVKSESSEPVWVPPPYPKPAFHDDVFLQTVEGIVAGWTDVDAAHVLVRRDVLQQILDATPSDELYSRTFYLENKEWVEWTVSKHQILNSNIHMLSQRASRILVGVVHV